MTVPQNEPESVSYRLTVGDIDGPNGQTFDNVRISTPGDNRLHYLLPYEPGQPSSAIWEPIPVWQAMYDGLVAAGYAVTFERIATAPEIVGTNVMETR